MTPLPVRLLVKAKQDFDDAIEWYEARSTSLAIDFISKLRQVLERLALHSQFHRPIYQNVRKAPLKRFPYVVVYQPSSEEIIVIAIQHMARDDSHWQQRLST